jgi:ribosomal-protein-serine acetyltransferase
MKNIPPPEKITCNRVTLVKHHPNFAQQEFTSINSNRKRLREFMHFVDTTHSTDDILHFITDSSEEWRKSTAFRYAIFLDDQYIGNLWFENICWEHRRCEIGYWLLKKYEGQGYISECIQKSEEILFALGINRIAIHCFDHNSKSKKTALRNGYTFEGTLQQYISYQGQFHDWCIFSKTKKKTPLDIAVAVVAILIHDDKCLFLHRNSPPKNWCPPCGSLHYGEDPVDGLRREVFEETGLAIKDIKPIKAALVEHDSIKLISLSYTCISKSNDVKLSDEHHDFQWIPIDQLATVDLDTDFNMKEIYRKNEMV